MLRKDISLWKNFRNFLIPCSLTVFILLLLCWISVSSGSRSDDRSLNLLKRSHLGNDNVGGVNDETRKLKKRDLMSSEEINQDSDLHNKVSRRDNDETDSSRGTLLRRATMAETSPTCGTQCIIIIVICSVLLLSLALGTLYIIHRRRLKGKIADSKQPEIFIWDFDGENFAIAEQFTKEHPPQDELPPLELIPNIQELGGAKAWEWLPVESLLNEQTLSIANDGKVITFNKRTDSMIQTNYPFFIPVEEGKTFLEDPFEQPETAVHRSGQPLHYFEITVLANPDKKNNIIAIGVATKPYPPFRLPGLNVHSVGYHSNGRKFYDSTGGQNYGSPWGDVGDTIGCAYNPATGGVFFTKNGVFLGNAFTSLHHVWFPTIGSTGPCTIQTNFGDSYECYYRYENAIGYGPGGPLLKRKGGPSVVYNRRPRVSRSSSMRSTRSVKSNASFGGS